MGLDDNIKTILNTGWDTAITEVVEEETVPIIAKPTFHLNLEVPNGQLRNLWIDAKFEGTLEATNNDNSTDERITEFELTGFEADEDESIKAMRIIKYLLHSDDLSKGHYHIDIFRIIEDNPLKGYVMQGHQFQSIEDDEFL